MNPVYVALDTPKLDQALELARAVAPWIGGVKLGLEFFCAHGPDGVAAIAALERPIFLDLKLHDIPNTVAGAVRSLERLAPQWLTLHAAGGAAMLAAARRAVDAGPGRTRLLGVTVLTSLDDGDLNATGQHGPAAGQVQRLAGLGYDSRLDGLVCAPTEVGWIRKAFGPGFAIVTAGIRPDGAQADDQRRTASPAAALAAGADILVIGRPITAAADPAAAAAAILAGIGSRP